MKRKNKKKPIPKHRILKEIYRHYIDFEDLYKREGIETIEIGKDYYPDKPLEEPITISFLDLKYGLDKLSKRKKEAFLYNIIYDKRQEDVAKIMGVTTVTVGQYVEAAAIQLSKRYFADTSKEDTTDS